MEVSNNKKNNIHQTDNDFPVSLKVQITSIATYMYNKLQMIPGKPYKDL